MRSKKRNSRIFTIHIFIGIGKVTHQCYDRCKELYWSRRVRGNRSMDWLLCPPELQDSCALNKSLMDIYSAMNKKAKINWEEVVSYICNDLFFSQKDLAELCNVTQQSISNCKCQVRFPGPYAKKKMVELLQQAGVSIDTFRKGHSESMHKSQDVALQELIDIYSELPMVGKTCVLEFARFSKLKIKK